jgi:hypothetical protein
MTQLLNPQNSVGITKKPILESLPNITSKELLIYNNDIELVKFKDYSTPKELALMTSLLVKWCNYLGIQTPDAHQLNVICNFIKEHFENLNHQDLDNVIMMVVTDSLKTDAEHYGTLSIIYINKCIKDYVSYRSSVFVKIRQQLEKMENEKLKQISPEERISNLKKLIEFGVQDVKDKKTFQDFGDAIYNFIKANKLIKLDTDLINEAMDYGNTLFEEEKKRITIESAIKKSHFKTTFDLKFEKEDKIKKYAREFVVNQWLKNLNFKEFKDKITPDMLNY